MMKKVFKLLSLICSMTLLCGCMHLTVIYDVGADGSVKEGMRYLFSEEYLAMGDGNIETALDNMAESMKKEYPDASVQKITEKDGDTSYAGVEITGMDADLEAKEENGTLVFEIPAKGLESSLSDDFGGGEELDFKSLKEYGCEIRMVVNMPNRAETNAGEVNGKTVTVDLLNLPADIDTIRITCRKNNSFGNTWIFLAAGLLIMAGGWFVLRKKAQ